MSLDIDRTPDRLTTGTRGFPSGAGASICVNPKPLRCERVTPPGAGPQQTLYLGVQTPPALLRSVAFAWLEASDAVRLLRRRRPESEGISGLGGIRWPILLRMRHEQRQIVDWSITDKPLTIESQVRRVTELRW